MNETIDELLKYLLQKYVSLFLNNKLYRSGKVILFKHKNYFIELILQNESKEKRVEIPIPFLIENHKEENLLFFDYRLKTLAKNNSDIYNKLLMMSKKCKSRYFNTILEIEVKS